MYKIERQFYTRFNLLFYQIQIIFPKIGDNKENKLIVIGQTIILMLNLLSCLSLNISKLQLDS
jgi:hypothetical protein